MDLEKAFDSLDHNFLLCVLKKFGFDDNYITWINMAVVKWSAILHYKWRVCYSVFHIKKRWTPSDPILACLFIVALDVLFTLIKSKDNINGTDLYDYSFLFTANADNSTFFFKDIASVRILVDTFKVFSCFTGLKPNINKREIADSRILKRAQEAVCGLQNINLTKDTIKILGIHFSYNKKFKQRETI